MSTRPRPSAIAVLALLVVVAACGTGTSDGESLRSPVGGPADPTTTIVAPATTTIAASTTTTAEPPPTTTLPGEPWDFAIAGTVADVAGIAFDEVFVIRTLPGAEQPVAASLPPLTQLVLTGRGRQLDQGPIFVVWLEVTAGSATGWIPQHSLVYLSESQDITADIVAEVGVRPTAPTMLELGKTVTDAYSRVPPPDIVLASEPSAGTTSEVVYDVFPDEAFGDDTTNGSRLRVTGRQVPVDDLPETGFAGALGYELVSVETTSLCRRGVDASSGFCV